MQHARAALELNPYEPESNLALTLTLTLTLALALTLALILTRYEPESNELLQALLGRPGAAAAERAGGWQADAPAAAEVAPC